MRKVVIPQGIAEGRAAWLIHVRDDGKCWWIIFNMRETLRGRLGESKRQLIARWVKKHGPLSKVIRFAGRMRLSEAVVTMTTIKHPISKVECPPVPDSSPAEPEGLFPQASTKGGEP